MKILIADDDPHARNWLSHTLEALAHTVVIAVDGTDAWKRLQAEEYSLVILDWMMPGIDGPDLCRLIRSRDAIRGGRHYTFLILLTARNGPEDRVCGYESGADDFLTKPLDRGELAARLGVAIRILSMQREHRAHSKQLEAAQVELHRQYEKLAEIAVCDSLTGLKNRRHFCESLERAYDFSCRKRLPLSVVMIDVDRFKPYNDSFGHPAGDQALADIGRLLSTNAREHDLVARYGGEEFVMLLAATDRASSVEIANRLRCQVERHAWPLRPLTASFGAATSTPQTGSAFQLVDEADRALYLSKGRGRNCVTHAADMPPRPHASLLPGLVGSSVHMTGL